MTGFAVLAYFLICGIITIRGIFPRKGPLTRVWLGMCAGLLMMMWLPIPFALFIRFTVKAQYGAMICAAVISLLSFLFRSRALPEHSSGNGPERIPGWILLVTLVPFTLLSGYLLYTHTLRAAADGSLHVGQSTYGDLCLHLGIATGARNAVFPFLYTLIPDTVLGYPFLGDTMVTTMLLFGTDLTQGFVVTSTLMMALVYTGFLLFTWRITGKKGITLLAFFLMFVNGGLGFLYVFDGVFKDSSMLSSVFTGFYQAPANMPDLNLRWVNVICDMMIPQRTLLTGWTVLLPALYFLTEAAQTRKIRYFVVLGVWGGLMPMVHTHSFFALGLASAGLMVHSVLTSRKRGKTFLRWALYGALAALFAAPQLLYWTFPQTLDGGSLALRFNWVNNQGNGKLIDGYFWFWIKNVGLVYIVMVPAFFLCKKGSPERGLCLGALLIYTTAEFIQFQPNPYDNNKLFYVAYMIMLPIAVRYLDELYRRLRGLPGRNLLAGLFLLVSTASGALSIARETVSDYQLFSASEVEAARFIEENTDPDSRFLTGDQHNNLVTALTGRNIVCGTGSYLYYHGIPYSTQWYDELDMLRDPADHLYLFEQYGIDYVMISNNERYSQDADEDWFADNLEEVFRSGPVILYRWVSPESVH